jgi:Zn-dependent protease with chaperone function
VVQLAEQAVGAAAGVVAELPATEWRQSGPLVYIRRMTTTPAEAFRLPGISPKAYEHPADRAATAALASIPYMDPVVRKLIELGERRLRSVLLGGSVRLGQEQLPRLWALHHRAYDVLDIEPLPELYVTQRPDVNALTIGSKTPFVLVFSDAVQLLDDDGMRVVLAHEAGHVLSDHGLYRTALEILMILGRAPMMRFPIRPIIYALMEWYRASELSSDRAAALVTRDPELVCRTLMSVGSGLPANELDLNAFIAQAEEFSQGDGWDWLSRRTMQLTMTHPMIVNRTKQLLDWVRSGEYDRIVGGAYMKRGEEPPPREAATDAMDHYGDRAKETFTDAAKQMEKTSKQVGEWLQTGSDWVRGTANAAAKAARSRDGGKAGATDEPESESDFEDEDEFNIDFDDPSES